MTITSYDNRRTYAGNGSTVAFSFPPPFTVNTDLVVQLQAADGTITTKVIATDYTVSSPPYTSGGTVTMVVAPATGQTLIIYRDVPVTQGITLLDGGPLPASTVNGMFDRLTMIAQRTREMANTSFALVTQTMNGLMSATDKVKLDGIAAGAQVNTINASGNLAELVDKAASRTNLGVAIGTNVQAYSARLAEIASISWVQGDVLYFNGSALVKLAAGTAGQVLTTQGAATNPSWTTVAGTGTVTSVGMTVPSFLSVSGGPITGSGTFAVTLSGTALPVANGGTGQTALATASEVQAAAAKISAMDGVLAAMAWGALTDGATIAVDHAGGVNRTVTIAGNRTVGNPTNPKVGWPLNIEVTQDGTGSRTLSWSANFSFGSGGAPSLSTAAGAVDLLAFVCRSSTKFVYLGITRAV